MTLATPATLYVTVADLNDPDSTRTLPMSDDEARDTYPHWNGRDATLTSRDGALVHITRDPRVVGGTYHSGYWGQSYTVTAITHGHPVWGTQWTCVWDDGRTTTHSTDWNFRRDRVVATTPEGTN